MMMIVMMAMMPLMVEVEISARWLKNTQKALVVQLRSAEQDSGRYRGIGRGVGGKAGLLCFELNSLDCFLAANSTGSLSN